MARGERREAPVEVAGTYRMVRDSSDPPPRRERERARSQQDSVPDSVFGAITSLQVEVASLKSAVTSLQAAARHETTKLLVGLATAALAVIGGQRALAPAPPPPVVELQQSELQIRAEGCAKMANGNDETYVSCMAREVVAPNAPSARSMR